MHIFIDYNNINNSVVHISNHKNLFLIAVLLKTKYLMEFFQKYHINSHNRLFFHYLRESNRNNNDNNIIINDKHRDYSTIVHLIPITIPLEFFLYTFANIINIQIYDIILFNNMFSNLQLQEITLITKNNSKTFTTKIFTIIENSSINSYNTIPIKYTAFHEVILHNNIHNILQVPLGFLNIRKTNNKISATLTECL